jgi:hypothetical protein
MNFLRKHKVTEKAVNQYERDGGTEGRRDGGTEGRRDGGTEGPRDGGTYSQRLSSPCQFR